jgi:hypothetical protein
LGIRATGYANKGYDGFTLKLLVMLPDLKIDSEDGVRKLQLL